MTLVHTMVSSEVSPTTKSLLDGTVYDVSRTHSTLFYLNRRPFSDHWAYCRQSKLTTPKSHVTQLLAGPLRLYCSRLLRGYLQGISPLVSLLSCRFPLIPQFLLVKSLLCSPLLGLSPLRILRRDGDETIPKLRPLSFMRL